MPSLPPQLYDVYTADPSIYMHDNKLKGTFPWDSLTAVATLTLSNNQFEGNIKLPKDYKHFRAINLTTNNFNGMFPCMMDNHHLEFLEARFNKFDSIATDKDDNCVAWPKALREILLSDNQIKGRMS